MEVDLKVVEHRKTETADKVPKFTVRLKGLTADGLEAALSIKGEKEDLLKKYALKTEHTVKLSQPQSRLG